MLASSTSRRSNTWFNPSNSKYTVKNDDKVIETTVTNKAVVADEWVRDIKNRYRGKSSVAVGLDVEWKPVFVRGRSSRAATLQLCVDDKCLILQLLYMDKFSVSLKRFFMDSKFSFVGVEVESDITKLGEDYGLRFKEFKDIRELAKGYKRWSSAKPGLKELASHVCGVHLEKPKRVCMSNWEARTLSKEQVEYACLDAYASFCVGHKLLITGSRVASSDA